MGVVTGGGGGGGGLPSPITTPVTIANATADTCALTVSAEHDLSPADAGTQIASLRQADGTVVATFTTTNPVGDATDGTLAVAPGKVIVRMAEDTADAFMLLDSATGNAILQVDSGGGLFVHSPPTGAGLDVVNTDGSSHTVSAFPAFDLIWFCNFMARIMGGVYFTSASTAPADDDLSDGEMAIYFDPTNGAAKLKVKAKQADGTVRTGSLALA